MQALLQWLVIFSYVSSIKHEGIVCKSQAKLKFDPEPSMQRVRSFLVDFISLIFENSGKTT